VVFDLFGNHLEVGMKCLYVCQLTKALLPATIIGINKTQIIVKHLNQKKVTVRIDRASAVSDNYELIVSTRIIKHANQND